MTVFLTTQYLEEADVLADRVGIIDHGRIVAEGTPDALKAEIGRPTVEVDAGRPGRRRARADDPRAASASRARRAHGVAVRLRGGQADLAGIVRALDTEGIGVEQLQLHQPSLDDVFLAKTGRSLEGAERRSSERRASRWTLRERASSTRSTSSARRSVVRTIRQPANVIAPLLFPLLLLAVNAGGLKAETNLPGFPTARSSRSCSRCRSSRARCSRR